MTDIPKQIFNSLIADMFNRRVMGNLYRPHYVERLVEKALGDGFKLISGDWAGWDIDGPNGLRVEVKQSAAQQTWSELPSLVGKPTKGRFDIAARTGYWTDGGNKWVDRPGRQAHIYILAWHSVTDLKIVDQRLPEQWIFFVVPSHELLAGQKTISRTVVEKKWPSVIFDELRNETLRVADKLQY